MAESPGSSFAWIPPPARARGRFPAGTLAAALILAGGVFADAKLARNPLWTVGAISVEGNRSIPADTLLARLHLRPGMPLWRVSRDAAAGVRAAEPRLSALSVSWVPPRDLRVRAEERESCLRIPGPPSLEVARDGILMEPSETCDPADLPLLTGDLPAGFRPGQRCAFAGAPGWQELLALSDDSPTLWRAISEIHYDSGSNFQLYLREGRKVILWQTDINRDLKQQVTRILGELRRQGVDDAVIDLRFRDQAVVRLPEGADSASSQIAPARARTQAASARTEAQFVPAGAGVQVVPARTGAQVAPAHTGAAVQPAAVRGQAMRPASTPRGAKRPQHTPNRRHRA